jgi:outer membrane protein assembly factor BamB
MQRHFRVALVSFSVAFTVISTLLAEDYPQWRGPNRDGHSLDKGLLESWPEGGPQVLWQVDSAGVGYSSPVVKDGRVITQGDLDGVEHIICYSEKDGSQLWAVQPEPVAKALAQQVEQQFAKLDANQDGTLDELEAWRGLGSNGLKAESAGDGNEDKVASERAARLFAMLDEDDNGRLTFDEVPQQAHRDFFQRADRQDREADADAIAAARVAASLEFDKDDDGKVSSQEARGTILQMLFRSIDQKTAGEPRGDGVLTKEEIESYFAKNERGRDGVVTGEELTRYYRASLPGRDGKLTKADVQRNYGGYRNGQGNGPRGTPTIDGDRVYTEGGNGDVTCLDAATGKTIWHLNLVRDLSGGRPSWGYCESPLVIDDLLVVTPGGNLGTIAALNKNTGKVVWRSADVKQGAHYSSPVLAEIAGVTQIVQFARNTAFGVRLDGGGALWNYSGANNGTANVCTPIVEGDYVLTSSGYGTGTGLAKVSNSDDSQEAEEIYFDKRLAVHHGGIVKVGDYIYGLGGSTLVCKHFETGETAWQARSVGKGSLCYADGHLYCLSERNEVGLVEANPEKYVEKGRFRIPKSDRPSWAHPVIANGRLYIRDQGMLACYDVRAN